MGRYIDMRGEEEREREAVKFELIFMSSTLSSSSLSSFSLFI